MRRNIHVPTLTEERLNDIAKHLHESLQRCRPCQLCRWPIDPHYDGDKTLCVKCSSRPIQETMYKIIDFGWLYLYILQGIIVGAIKSFS